MEKTRTNFQSNRINTHESQGDAVRQTEIGLQADRHMDDNKYMDMEKIQERALRFVHGDYASDYNLVHI